MISSIIKGCELAQRNKFKHVLEFGVADGGSTRSIRNSLPPEYNIFAFDSFEGLPEDWQGTICKKGFFSTGGVIPNIDGVQFFKGWFEDTIGDYLKIAQDISLLHVDCDLYSSTKTIFSNLYPFIKPGTIIVFDEWIYNFNERFNDHEQKAFFEFVDQFKINFKFVDFNDTTPCGIERKIVEIL